MGELNQVNQILTDFQKVPSAKKFCKTWDAKTNSFHVQTYGNLTEDIRRLQTLLKSFPNSISNSHTTPILIASDQGYWASAFILATWMTGHHYLPINDETPRSRLISLLLETQPSVILLENFNDDWIEILKQTHFAGSLVVGKRSHPPKNTEHLKYNIFFLHDLESSTLCNFSRPLNGVAYLMATSGTTGRPKLIRIFDSQLSSYIDRIRGLLPSNLNCLIQTCPITFDPSIGDLLWTLMHQGCLVPLLAKNARFLPQILLQEEPFWWASTPSFSRFALSFLKGVQNRSVQCTFFWGEILTAHHCEVWGHVFTNSQIFNLYGPTESTITVAFHKVIPSELNTQSILPIGKLHPDHFAMIMPQTEELLLSGPQVISSYPQIENNQDRFSFLENKTWYRTGDRAREDSGIITIIGRVDNQIKIHGQRMELTEMELHLERQGWPVILLPITDENPRMEVHHLIGVTEVAGLKLEQLSECLKDHFPTHFFPRSLIVIDKFPLTKNLKIDRAALLKLVSAHQ